MGLRLAKVVYGAARQIGSMGTTFTEETKLKLPNLRSTQQ